MAQALHQLVEQMKTHGIGGEAVARIQFNMSGGVVQGVAGAENVQIGSMTLRCAAQRLAAHRERDSRWRTVTSTTTITGGQIQGVAGAGTVVIENFTIYNRAAEEPAAAGAEPIAACPYPGLAYFGPSDADLFFGRDAAITRLAEAVGRQSFTALVGASGSGKSSVVLAGSGAAAAHDARATGASAISASAPSWSSNPFLALARALAPLYVASDSDVERSDETRSCWPRAWRPAS